MTELEVNKLQADIWDGGLNLVVFGEWSDQALSEKHVFTQNFTGKVWKPHTSGADTASLNTFLAPFDIELGESALSGVFLVDSDPVRMETGSHLSKFPAGGYLFSGTFQNDTKTVLGLKQKKTDKPVLGFIDFKE